MWARVKVKGLGLIDRERIWCRQFENPKTDLTLCVEAPSLLQVYPEYIVWPPGEKTKPKRGCVWSVRQA